MSTLLLNIETICQHSNMLSLSLCPLTQDIALHAQWIFSSPRGRFSPLNLTYLTYWILLYPQAIRGINTKLFLFSGKYWADFWHRDYIETLFSIHEFCRITRTVDCQEIEREGEIFILSKIWTIIHHPQYYILSAKWPNKSEVSYIYIQIAILQPAPSWEKKKVDHFLDQVDCEGKEGFNAKYPKYPLAFQCKEGSEILNNNNW